MSPGLSQQGPRKARGEPTLKGRDRDPDTQGENGVCSRGTRWSQMAASPGAAREPGERCVAGPPGEPLEGAPPCRQLDATLLATKTPKPREREHISIVVSHPVGGTLLWLP